MNPTVTTVAASTRPEARQSVPQIRIAVTSAEVAIPHLRYRVSVTEIVRIPVTVSSRTGAGSISTTCRESIAAERPLLGAHAATEVEALRAAHSQATVHGWGCRGTTNARAFRAAAVELGELLTAAQFRALGIEA